MKNEIKMIDCQMTTKHLVSLGAREINRKKFLEKLQKFLEKPTLIGKWGIDFPTNEL